MVHGDDRGLVLPPKVAPTQVILVPIMPKKARAEVLEKASAIFAELKQSGLRIEMDDREEYSPGWKFNEWEMKGVPLRLEVGPRDLAAGQAVLARRDTGDKVVALTDLTVRVPALLAEIQNNMLEKAKNLELTTPIVPMTTKSLSKLLKKNAFCYLRLVRTC